MNSTISEFAPLTHEEAVREVYKLTPQIREYDEFMYLGIRWLPYTMFFHHPNYVSDVINTDAFGFRYSLCDGKKYGVSNLPQDRPVNLLVGGSTGLGTGATNDGATISSQLANLTGEVWLNFSGRGYNAVQEVLMFLMHQHRFTRINNVIVLSGINTLTLEGIPDNLSSDHGRYYYSYEYNHYMGKYNDDLRRRQNTYASSLDDRDKGLLAKYANFVRGKRAGENPADIIITDDGTDTAERVQRAAWVIGNSVYQWKQLLQPFQANLLFLIQPMSYWVHRNMPSEEREIFHAIDSCPNNFWRLFGKILDPKIHEPFSDDIRKSCENHGIKFGDLNRLLESSPILDENIFVDRVHFNDRGYAEVARIALEALH